MNTKVFSALLLTLSLSSCGGGDGPGTDPPPPAPAYTLGGTVSGTQGALTLQNDGGSDLDVQTDGTFTFATPVQSGAGYDVTVKSAAGLQTCAVTNGTGTATANVTNVAIVCSDLTLAIGIGAVHEQSVEFVLHAVAGAAFFALAEDVDGAGTFTRVVGDIPADALAYQYHAPLLRRTHARYRIDACTVARCISSNVVEIGERVSEGILYAKSPNTGADDRFGNSVALSDDGRTLVVGAPGESSSAAGGPDDNSRLWAGAVYVHVRDDDTWSSGIRLKAANADAGDKFGTAVALSADGNRLVVGAPEEDGGSSGVDGDPADNGKSASGAVYVFEKTATGWTQTAYLKASNADTGDKFGEHLALSADGDTLAVGARLEASGADGVNGDGSDDATPSAGAVYVFNVAGGIWQQSAYVKATNSDSQDLFGNAIGLSGDGRVLAVGAFGEDSKATDIGGDQEDNSRSAAGAAYVYRLGTAPGDWSYEQYIKPSSVHQFFGQTLALSRSGDELAVSYGVLLANSPGNVVVFTHAGGSWIEGATLGASNANLGDSFGFSMAFSGDGNSLALGATLEQSNARGIGGDQSDNSLRSGAAYLFARAGSGWAQAAYIKAKNTGLDDEFGCAVALDLHGEKLAVGAYAERGSLRGIWDSIPTGGDDDSLRDAGAVYLY